MALRFSAKRHAAGEGAAPGCRGCEGQTAGRDIRVRDHHAAPQSHESQKKTSSQSPIEPLPAQPTHRPAADIDSYQPPDNQSWDVDELTRAARSLADAFNGKIINFDDDTSIEETIAADTLIPNIADIMGGDGLDALEDDDSDSTPF